MSQSTARAAILRTLAFHAAWGVLPTESELILSLDVAHDREVVREEIEPALKEAISEGMIRLSHGRVGYRDTFDELFREMQSRDVFQPRKRRRAVRVARWLSHIDGVRAVFLANTTALGNARDGGDLDFFMIVKAGTMWRTRICASGPMKVFGLLPQAAEQRDAVCLSYFVADSALDLSSHQLPGDDPYFRHWFLSLLPLYDDGIMRELWEANAALLARHPFARAWACPPDLQIARPSIRIKLPPIFEPLARTFQMKWFPPAIRDMMNKDTRVIVSDDVLKFHVTDGRETYRAAYESLCRINGITA